MTRARGFTLIEVLTVAAVMALLAVGVARTFQTGLSYEIRARRDRTAERATRVFEDRLRTLLEHAYLSSNTTDTGTYFTTTPASSPGTTTNNNNNQSATLVFTAVGLKPAGAVLNPSQEDDFETLNEKYGPQGGVAEIQLGTSPTGQPTGALTGLFLREQRPADADASQGGTERVFNPDVSEIQFEFFDGATWQPTWDTVSSGTRRLPAAVRVTYTLTSETQQHVLVIRLPNSDVTTANPVTAAG